MMLLGGPSVSNPCPELRCNEPPCSQPTLHVPAKRLWGPTSCSGSPMQVVSRRAGATNEPHDSGLVSQNSSESPISLSTRRLCLAAMTGAAVLRSSFLGSESYAEATPVQKIVRLKDVKNIELQDALRAAVAGDLERAEGLFSKLIAQTPENASVWSNRGSVRLSLEKFNEAKEDFTKAIELAPYAPVPFLNRSIALEALERYSEAVADCKSAIENDPEEYAAWFNLGNVQVKLKDYPAAFMAYERAAGLAPGIAGYRLREAMMMFQLDRVEDATRVLQGLVRKYPNYSEAHAALAAVLWEEDKRGAAEEEYSEASLQEPRFKNLIFVRDKLNWPPGISTALNNFLSLNMQR